MANLKHGVPFSGVSSKDKSDKSSPLTPASDEELYHKTSGATATANALKFETTNIPVSNMRSAVKTMYDSSDDNGGCSKLQNTTREENMDETNDSLPGDSDAETDCATPPAQEALPSPPPSPSAKGKGKRKTTPVSEPSEAAAATPMASAKKKAKRTTNVKIKPEPKLGSDSEAATFPTAVKAEASSASTSNTRNASEQVGSLASDWNADRWNDLNFAILKVVMANTSALYEASPSLTPWRFKGRLLPRVRTLLKDSQGGEAAAKKWDIEEKPIRAKGSPVKKAKK